MESRNLYAATATVRLKKGQGRILKVGGAWVYDSEIGTITEGYENRDLAAVEDFNSYGLGHGSINTNSELTARMLSRKKGAVIDQSPIEMQARDAWEYRKATVDTSSYRILFGEADSLPSVVIDKSSDVPVVESLALGADRLKPMIVKTLRRVPTENRITIRGIYECSDAKVRLQEGMKQYKGLIGEPFDAKVEILEGGVRYLVDVKDGQKTEFFLDQKYDRLAVQDLCRRIQSDRVLNCFTYTGLFALSAGLADSKDVLDVDASCPAMNRANKNAVLNGIRDRVHFRCADVLDLLPRLEQDGQELDVTILDPPAPTRSKNSVENAVKRYGEINLRGMKLVEDGGYPTTCSCSHSMDPELFAKTTREVVRNMHKRLRQVEYCTKASDHPILWAVDESYYLKFCIFQVYDEK